MHKLLLIVILLVSLSAQEYKVTIDKKYNEPMLVGQIKRENLIDSNFAWWYNPKFEDYKIDTTTLDKIGDSLVDKNITIVMGTWCGDSHREVPRFFKVLDYLGYNSNSVKLLAVDREKKALHKNVKDLEIELVPTFIIYDDGKELGRIVESPKESLEKDLLNILK